VLGRLGDAIATQRRFMADASHELRTPVSIMRTAADVTLNQPTREEGEYREALTAVSQQSARLARLVDDMLVLARSDAGGYPVVRAVMDLDGVVQDSIRELTPRAAARGPGIPLEQRDRVFERFVRLDPARGEGGTGLGLSIARWAAETHGGRVDIVRSGPDGTVFSATLPADPLTV
jgi:signal transduction histidine kinase